VSILPHGAKLFCSYFVNSCTQLFEVVTWQVQKFKNDLLADRNV